MRRFLARLPFVGSWFSKDKDFVSAPRRMRDHAIRAYSYAKDVMERVLGKSRDAKVDHVLVPTNRIHAGIPIFQHQAYPGVWIYGLYDIQRAVVYLGEYAGRYCVPTLKHEQGHHHASQFGIYGHDQRFDAYFDGWKETRNVTGWRVSQGLFAKPTLAMVQHVYLSDDSGPRFIIDALPE